MMNRYLSKLFITYVFCALAAVFGEGCSDQRSAGEHANREGQEVKDGTRNYGAVEISGFDDERPANVPFVVILPIQFIGSFTFEYYDYNPRTGYSPHTTQFETSLSTGSVSMAPVATIPDAYKDSVFSVEYANGQNVRPFGSATKDNYVANKSYFKKTIDKSGRVRIWVGPWDQLFRNVQD